MTALFIQDLSKKLESPGLALNIHVCVVKTLTNLINPNHPESIKIHPPVLEDFGGFRIPPH